MSSGTIAIAPNVQSHARSRGLRVPQTAPQTPAFQTLSASLTAQRQRLLKLLSRSQREQFRNEFWLVFNGLQPALLATLDLPTATHLPICAVVAAAPLNSALGKNGRISDLNPLKIPSVPYALVGVELVLNPAGVPLDPAKRLTCFETALLVRSFPELEKCESFSSANHRFFFNRALRIWEVGEEPPGYPSGKYILTCRARTQLHCTKRRDKRAAKYKQSHPKELPWPANLPVPVRLPGVGLWDLD